MVQHFSLQSFHMFCSNHSSESLILLYPDFNKCTASYITKNMLHWNPASDFVAHKTY